MSKNNSFMFYPEITDNDFDEKIYLKKEFRDTFIDEKKENTLIKKKDFILQPHQIFLKNYISPDTPYNGILVFHGTGVGKTCSAISIAEGFKKTLKNMNKKILIITNLKGNFMKELFNVRKENEKKNPEDIVQCTGRDYELGQESQYLTRDEKKKQLTKLINSYYQFFGYQKFANYIIENTGGWKGDEKDINEKVKKFIAREFDDRVIIIDEIQNIKTEKKEDYTKNIQPILESIIKYSKNIKLVLMSATPMFDRPDEILFHINLLLQNDGRKKINKSDIFNSKDGTLKEDAEKKLREIFRGYVSYVRGEKPFTFPFRIYPKEAKVPHFHYYMSGSKIESDKEIKFTKLILCDMKGVQLNTYINYFEKKIKDGNIKKNIDDKVELLDDNENDNQLNKSNENNKNIKGVGFLRELTKISNITYPISDKDINNSNGSNNESNNSSQNIGSFKSSMQTEVDNGMGGYYKVITNDGTKKKIQYRYQSHAIFHKDTKEESPFADEKNIMNYSIKFSKILEVIKKSKGLIFIYSRFIDQGALPFALFLEQNGYIRDCVDTENQLLDYSPNKLGKGGRRKPICYLCGNEASNPCHSNEKLKDYHPYKIAKYVLFFGNNKSDIIKIKREQLLEKFTSSNNKYGEEIKIIIGTRVISEGLDFKRIRQVHIIDPWYNLSRPEQIIGRAIRFESHEGLLPEEFNVEIFEYASVIDHNNKYGNRETIDIKNYRIAEAKDRIIKNITRIMKESAVDCVLFRNANIIKSDKTVKQITSSGNVIHMKIEDNPFTPICDYKESCNYKCNWMPNPRIKYPINTDTYNIRFATLDIETAKKYIKKMFRNNIVFHLQMIEDYISKKIPNINKLFIYTALDQLVNNKNEIVYDKFSRKGYIIYKGDYYLFQPFDLEREELPLIYRMYPTNIKINSVDLENIDFNYVDNKEKHIEKNKKKEVKNTKLINNILIEFNDMFSIHSEIYKSDSISNKKEYILSIIGTILNNVNVEDEIFFIKNIIIEYLQNDDKENHIIEQFINYYQYKNILINYYSDIQNDKKKIKENIFVGFILYNQYFILDMIKEESNKDLYLSKNKLKKYDLQFVECSKDIINKIKEYRALSIKKNINTKKKYNIIYGKIIINDKKKTKEFKIVNKSQEDEILTKEYKISKRSIISGRVCKTFNSEELNMIRNKLKMYPYTEKKAIKFICNDIQIYLRYKELTDTKNIWVEDI